MDKQNSVRITGVPDSEETKKRAANLFEKQWPNRSQIEEEKVDKQIQETEELQLR